MNWVEGDWIGMMSQCGIVIVQDKKSCNILLVNALSKAGIGTPSADEIMVDIPIFSAPESVQVPQHFAKEEDKMVMDSDKKLPESCSLPAIPVTSMAQEQAIQPEAGIIIQGAFSVSEPLPGSLLVQVPPTPTLHSVPTLERLVSMAFSEPLADAMSVDKEPTEKETASLLGLWKIEDM